ncbi:preprotein translocase subunit SecG [Pelagicoccus sp. NFK12]|uniref:Protein-export membrane protein SecG n=1 Tax=Pelagicoccus enzymogenes TaxID=2773457 RepID=A0A927FE37_9BACT|nr:preprotein translocase subunit SecG [Pelagicoccus enzymogenes]MBD5782000.1 preprotein translocase subunit SecG [Pelagicoccus enzymogenes]MDQ8196755.1 preprotein translocase subunit SecG [Pelagicoccus enzymogenes]
MDFLNGFLTVVLVLVSLFMILLVLMQRGNANGGLGAAMGGGMAESALGAETSSVLSKWTKNTAIVFFVLGFGLYLSKLHQHELAKVEQDGALPTIESTEPSPASDAFRELVSQAEEAAEETEAEATEAAAATENAVEDAAEAAPKAAE